MADTLEPVRAYYREFTEAYLACMGPTFQAGLVASETDEDPYVANNRYCAARADIRPGLRVLDAGCGVCGPALDMARMVPEADFVGVTLSPEQELIATRRIREARLEGRVRVYLADFHRLPFGDGTFDRVLFMESLCHSADVPRALGEAFRVLRPGGLVYVKDLFRKEEAGASFREKLEGFHRAYALRTLRFASTLAALATIGFREVEGRSLEGMASTRWMWDVMFEVRDGEPRLTRWGELHGIPLEAASKGAGDHAERVFYLAECLARKPDPRPGAAP